MSFKPFFDYELVTKEMAGALRDSLKKLRKLEDDLIVAHTAERQIVCTKRLLKAKDEIGLISKDIHQEVHTIPAMIHQAGEVKLEQDDDGSFNYVQRCSRCGSELTISDEEHGESFEEGDIIAKTSSMNGFNRRSPTRHMYFVGGRDLKKHELECVSLESIFGKQ